MARKPLSVVQSCGLVQEACRGGESTQAAGGGDGAASLPPATSRGPMCPAAEWRQQAAPAWMQSGMAPDCLLLEVAGCIVKGQASCSAASAALRQPADLLAKDLCLSCLCCLPPQACAHRSRQLVSYAQWEPSLHSRMNVAPVRSPSGQQSRVCHQGTGRLLQQ